VRHVRQDPFLRRTPEPLFRLVTVTAAPIITLWLKSATTGLVRRAILLDAQ
jgi:hypothetical protein